MAGIIWRVRITENYDLSDGMYYGEMIFNIEDNRFGIMDDIYMGWWPAVDKTTGDFIIPEGWFLSGKGGYQPFIQTSWEFPGELHFRPIQPTHPWVEEHALLDPFLVIKDGEQKVVAASDEKFNNGAPNSLENFEVSRGDLGYDIHITKDTTTASIKQLSGNGFLWVKSPDPNLNVHVRDVGSIDNALAIKNKGNSFQTWQVKGKNVIGFNVPSAEALFPNVTRGIGYRSFCFAPDMEKQKLTFSMVANAFGVPGLTFSTRIGYPGNWQMFTTTLTDTGQTHLTFKFDPSKVKAKNLGKPLIIDWFYDWFYQYLTFPMLPEIKFELAALTVHAGWFDAERLNPAFHAPTQENGYATLYGFQDRKVYAYKKRGSVAFDEPLLSDSYRLSLTTDKTMVITEKTRNGFVYESNAEEDTPWTFLYSVKLAGDVSDIL